MSENHFAFSLSQKWRKKYGKISDEKPMTSAMMCCGDHNSLFGLSLVSVQIQDSAQVSVKDWSKKWTDPMSVVGQNPATSCDDWWLAMAAGSMHSRKRKWIQLHWTIQLSWVQFSAVHLQPQVTRNNILSAVARLCNNCKISSQWQRRRRTSDRADGQTATEHFDRVGLNDRQRQLRKFSGRLSISRGRLWTQLLEQDTNQPSAGSRSVLLVS